MEPRLDRTERQTQPIGDLVEWHVPPEAEPNHDLLIGRKAPNQATQLVTSERVSERIAGTVAGDRLVELQDSMLAATAQSVVADVGDDPVEPGPEAVRVAKLRPGEPGLLRRVLDRVLGLSRIA